MSLAMESILASATDVIVEDQMGGQVYFKLRPDSTVGSLFDAYANRNANPVQSMMFQIKGTDRILTYFEAGTLLSKLVNNMDTLLVQ